MEITDEILTQCTLRDSCRTYLLTYSQANIERVPNCESFVKIITLAFDIGPSTSKIDHWGACIEEHADGGKHFHMAVKLSNPRRWHPVPCVIREQSGIVVNFSSKNLGYLPAYRYVCKDKPNRKEMFSTVKATLISQTQAHLLQKKHSRLTALMQSVAVTKKSL